MGGYGFPFSPPDYQYVIFFKIMLDKKHKVYRGASTLEQAQRLAILHVNYFPGWYCPEYTIKHKDDCTEKELSKISTWEQGE